MINIKSSREIELMRKSGKILYETHKEIEKHIRIGISTDELNAIAEDFIKLKGATASFKNYEGFPKSICTSINEVVVHGIPNDDLLKDGDIIAIDIGINYEGHHTDSAWTYKVGNVSADKLNLMEWTKEALYKGLEAVKPGNKIIDISRAIEGVAKKHNLGIVKELVGHGVGSKLHEEPEIPNYVVEKGPTLKVGMTLAIEPMLNLGSSDVCIPEDVWNIKTSDMKASAHYEHTVLVTENGYEILTGE